MVHWCAELLAPLGTVRVKRMFGGHGYYVDEIFIAILVAERLYLKVDDITRANFEAAGSVPFEYRNAHGQKAVMSYFSAPDDAMDAPAGMEPWARLAMASALRARASKPAAKKPKARRSSQG